MEPVAEFLKTLARKGVKLSAQTGQLNCYAPNGTLTPEIRQGIRRYKSEILTLLEGRDKRQQARASNGSSPGNGASPKVTALPPEATEFPLSAGQRGLYILQRVNPEMTAYNLPLCMRISGDLDVDILAQAWSRTLDRFPILTARIVQRDGTLCHLLDDACRTTIQQQAVAIDDEPQLLAFLRQRVKQPFDLEQGPLHRAELFTLGAQQRILLLTIHHMIFDGVSSVVLLQSLLASYQALRDGQPAALLPDLHGYQGFVTWEEAMVTSAEGQSHADYWQERLRGDLPSIELFADRPRPASPGFEGASVIETLPADLSLGILDVARRHSVRPSVVFLAAFKLLLHRYTGLDDIIVGMPVNVRPQRAFAAEVGYFINMVPLRTACSETLTLGAFLRDVQRTMLDAIAHASYPFELMLDKLRTGSGTKNSVFQVNYAYQNFITDASFASVVRQPGLDVQHVAEIGPEGYSDLGLEIFEKDAVFRVHVRYNPDVYKEEAIARLCGHYATLLDRFRGDEERRLQDYSIVSASEEQRLLVAFNDTQADYAKDNCIHDLFAERVASDPGRTAVVYGEQVLSYQQLYQESCRLAVHLQSLGVKPDSVVGLCVERSVEMMLGIMGTVQAGGAYLPLDPEYPDDRLTYMLQDSDAAIVLIQEKFRHRISSLVAPGTIVVSLDRDRAGDEAGRDWRATEQESQDAEPRREVMPHHACYVIYTSGSTGKPKGVLVEHRALVNRIHWMQKRYQLDESDVVLQKTPYSFDVSVWEFFWPMMAGAAVVFAAPGGHKDVQYLGRLIDAAKVTTLHFVPSMLRAYLDTSEARCGSVRRIFASGEALDREAVDRYRTPFPNAVLHNLYGPTEAAIDVTAFDCSQVPYPFVPIGSPIDNIQIHILDRHNHLQPIGVPGELHIAGDGLARGYLNRPDLTRERFVSNPFRPGARMYRTGDLACWLDDGNVQYLGRIDTQVKIRGFRVEVGEIEVRLNQHAQVLDSAVIARTEGADTRLVAFYRAKDTTADRLVQLPGEELRAHLVQTVPDYMVPAAFVSVAAIPLSSSGKVDRRALARMEVSLASHQAYLAPRSATEQQLVDLWADVLNLPAPTIGVNDDFFALGGHSLRAAHLVARIRTQLDVDVPLRAFFENGSVAQVAEFIARGETSAAPAIQPIARTPGERLPLGLAQERLWFLQQLEPESPGYNLPGAVRIRGALDLEHLERAFNLLIARHESLRTVFPSEDGRASQQILDRLDFRVSRVDLTDHADPAAREEEARRRCRADAATPFDLARGPLLRTTVMRLGAEEHLLLLTMHHIISDGWSIGVLIKELRELLEAVREDRSAALALLPIQYADYSVWQRQWLESSGTLAAQLAYWEQQLAGGSARLDLPTDFPRPRVQSLAGATQAFTLDAALTGALKRLADAQGATLFMVLLAAVKILLHRYTGASDVCVGSPIANRLHGETEGLIGMFVNTLALRTQVAGDDSVAACVAKVKATCLGAYAHQDAPFEQVVDRVRAERDLAFSPLFQVMVILQNVDLGTPDPHVQPYPVESGISKFDLTFELRETPEGLAGAIEYCTALYAAPTIARLVEHLTAVCRAMTMTPDARIRELEYLGAAETERLLVSFNATQAAYPTGSCLHDLFVAQATRTPDTPAIVCCEAQLTYEELSTRSEDLARYLQAQGVGPDDLVGLCLERSLDFVVGQLGILQAGGAYVPLDPAYPAERLAYMLRDSRAALVLTQASLEPTLRAALPPGTRLIAIDRQRAEIAAAVAALKAADVPLHRRVQPHHLAYVIYTSGSTGQPKGVAIEHHSPVTLVQWAHEVYSRDELAGVLAATSVCFDLSIFELFVPLSQGGTAILVPNALGLLDLPQTAGVTLINTVPSAIEELLRLGGIPDSVQTINLAGEPLSPQLVDAIYASTTVQRVYDLYGPSEDTTYSTYVLRRPQGPATIGRPIANTQVYILDASQRPQPIGVPGELHLAGAGLARGYLHRPDLTEEKFIVNPFTPGTRMYKTGDLARWRADGTLQYLGRRDTQVKIRGFRIELGEIEARLNAHSGIQESVVVPQEQEAATRLVAFYRAHETTAEHVVDLPSDLLRAHVAATVPDYMVPAAFVSLAAIPLNANGKVDRRALARMDVTLASAVAYVAPRTGTEQQLAAVWAEVLHRAPETIGVEDDFFALGGHSLLATQVMAAIRRELDVDVPLKALFERSRIAPLAELIATLERSAIPPIRPVERSSGERLPLSFAQERLWFLNQLEPDSPGYNVPGAVLIRSALDVDDLERAFNLLIARHESLRTVFPSEDGRAAQHILDRLDFRVARVDLTNHTDPASREEEARRRCRADAATPFDLARGPLLRSTVMRLGAEEHLLLLTMHHIVSDGWSIGVLIKELRELLAAIQADRAPALAPLPIQYADYSVWQRQWLESSGTLAAQLAYWEQQLAGGPARLDLPTDFPRPRVQSLAGATQTFTLDAALTGQLRRLADAQGATLFMVLLAAVKILLHRYTGASDVCVGSPIANRQYSGTEGLIGMFVNTLALRTTLASDETVAACVAKVKATCLAAYAHQDAPFEQVVDRLRPQRDLAFSPLFQVMVILQNVDMGTPDPHVQAYPVENGISKFDLTFELRETPEGLAGAIEYCTALYTAPTIARLVEHLTAMCQAMTARPDAPIRALDYLRATETEQLLDTFNATHAAYPTDACLHDLFVAQAARTPDTPAIVCGDAQLTYRDLSTRSQALALYLQAQGVGPDDLVGLCLERSLDLVVGQLGILQAGGAYVPLDPAYPAERLAYMLRDSRAALVLTQASLEPRLRAVLPPATRLIVVDQQRDEIAAAVAALEAADVPLRRDVRPHHLAYVIYTSGSTGEPKGVAIEHHSPVTLVHWAHEVYGGEELAGVLAATSVCFDLSIFELFVPLSQGGTAILVPNALGLLDLPQTAGVTLINTVPSAMEELLRVGGIPASVRTINLAGEPLAPALVDALYATTMVERVYDLYGPSEDTTYSTYVLRRPQGRATIGRPIANTQVYILDAWQQPQPIGVPGELHLAGAGLARGYLHRPSWTEEKFVTNPFMPGARMYKTGDLARWRADGTLEYLGRRDTQVKIRGFRIELGEIEARLTAHPAIQESVVVPQMHAAVTRLVAFYRAHETTAEQVVELPSDLLRAHVAATVPDYMVPAAFVSVASIPLNANSKVDRRALAQRDVTVAADAAYVAPRTATEQQLVAVWADVLHRAPETIGIEDDFFALGGHSLLATQVMAAIRRELDVDVPLKALFERSRIAPLAELIATLERSAIPPIRPVARTPGARLPLSFAQERLWFLQQLEPESPGYNLPGALLIRGALEVEQLERAFGLLIARHESLRTVFPNEDGRATQQILHRLDFRLTQCDLRHIADPAARDAEARRWCRADAAMPFDLARGPLLRGTVIRLADEEQVLLLTMHHIISDGWSTGVLIKELRELLTAIQADRAPVLAPLPIQYADYGVWQRQWLESSGTLAAQLAYWEQQLTGSPARLDLPTDFARPRVQSLAGATQTFTLDAVVAGQLRRLADAQGATLFMVLLAAVKILLARYTGASDLCVGSPIANRQYGETEGLIGMFVNTLALRTQVAADDSVAACVANVKASCLAAYAHQDAPFEQVVDRLRPQRDLAFSPLFQVMVILQNVDLGTPDPHVQPYPLDNDISKFDLTFELTETPEGLAGEIRYSTALYAAPTIARLADHLAAVCRAMTMAPEAPIRTLEYLSAAERQELLVRFNATPAAVPTDACLHELFAAQAARTPDTPAVVFGDEQLTYRELADKSELLARYLRAQGVTAESRVGLYLDRSLDMVVGMLAIWQAGGAYVPLDPDYPADRVQFMLDDAAPALVLTQARLLDRLLAGAAPRIALDRDWPHIAEQAQAMPAMEASRATPDNLAYVIYTSGSTGEPKGVMVRHRGVVNLWQALEQAVYAGQPAWTRVSVNASFTFDSSVKQFVQLLAGRTLVLVPQDVRLDAFALGRFLRRQAVDVFDCTPSQLAGLVRAGVFDDGAGGHPQAVLVGGEAIDAALWQTLGERPAVAFYNVYGPAECTVDATVARITADVSQPHLGRPIANVQIYILDRAGAPVPIGVMGEIHIGGAGVARGYWQRPALTEERFLADPFRQDDPHARLYKTGDLGRWRADGTIQYLGRNDQQLKIRGQRLELGEIEAQLARHPQVHDAVVIAREDLPGDTRLVAYVTTPGAAVEAEALRRHLLASLPSYMVPAAFVTLDRLPLTPNRKIDREALPVPASDAYARTGYAPPQGAIETTLAAIWQELLHVERVGREDDFFALGGHSLLATQLISAMRRALDVDVPLKAIFEQSRLAALAELIATAERNAIPPIRPVARTPGERIPLSFAQERLWFLNQLEPDSPGYNLPGAVTIRGALEIEHLERAFNLLIARHESLRTLFPSEDGRACQRILDRVEFRLARVDLTHHTDATARDEEARRRCRADAATPFDLARGPLLRGTVIRLAAEEHLLLLTMHHIISDGWSSGVLIKELRGQLEAVRAGRPPDLAPLPIQYADYAVWQRRWLEESGILAAQLAYWEQQLAVGPARLDLPTDFPRPRVQSLAGATQAFTLDAAVTGALRRLAEAQGATLFMALLAAVKILLHRYTGASDVCVGTPIANRQYGETEGLIGMFVNTLALRTQVDGDETVAACVAKVKATCLAAYAHQDAPFEQVVDRVHPQRDLAISALFQVMVILQNLDPGPSDPQVTPYPLDNDVSKFDLTIELTETPQGLAGAIRYSTALFTAPTIARLVAHLTAMCRAIAATPDAPIRTLEYLSAAEREELLVGFNATQAAVPTDACLHEIFAAQAARTPDTPAVVFGNQQLTYRQLADKSELLARYLRAQGVTADSRVGLYLDRSLDMVVGLLAIWQAGGAYVPLDPDYPVDRVQFMLEDAAPVLVLTQERLMGRLPPGATPLIALDRDWAAIEHDARTMPARASEAVRATADDLAYVIYTSGSTGEPKGVMVRHGGVVNLWHALEQAVYAGQPAWTRVSVNASFAFDSSVKQFVQLLAGRTLILVPQDVRLDAPALVRFLRQQAVDVFDCTPSQLTALVRAGLFDDAVGRPKAVLVGGEAIDAGLWRAMRECPDVAFYNVYGPAECTIDATVARITADAPQPHLGRPIANTQIYVLDRAGAPVPIGVVGEIHIGGAGVARGYWQRPALTDERFLTDPFRQDDPLARLYKTGDLGRWRADGTLQFAGRNDQQVKLRGQRIELGEIEAQLARHPQVHEAVVVAREDEPGEPRLVAYVTTTDAAVGAVGAAALRSHLLANLPAYMVPAAFVALERLPLTPNRKVDREALPVPTSDAYARTEYAPPQGAIETTLAAIWQDLLHVERVGREDDFFALGGHSLLAVQLMARVNRQFTRLLPLAVLFTAPTIAAFANLIASAEAPSFEILVPIQVNGDALPVFAVPGVGGNVLSLRPLGKALGEQQPLFALQAVGLDGTTPPFDSVEQTAEANLAAVRMAQPKGPYRLIGHSYGGVVAYEMARLLLEQGEEVASLVLLDSIAPSLMQRTHARDELTELVEACMALADLYGARLDLDIDRLRHASLDESIHALVDLLNARGLEITRDQFAAFHRVYRANQRCYRAYAPSQLPRTIDVSLYRATQRRPGSQPLPHDYGWGPLLQSPIRTADVEADHFSILERVPLRGVGGAVGQMVASLRPADQPH
jgi:amino acid adenylation domain-containing protein